MPNLFLISWGFLLFFALLLFLNVILRWYNQRKLLALLCSPASQKEEKELNQMGGNKDLRLSIVVVSDKDAASLNETLPHLLSQQFEAYEVVVVDMNNDDGETALMVKRFQALHKNLRYTFLPKFDNSPKRRGMAQTIGIRTAKADWVMLTSATAVPQTSQWLRWMYEPVLKKEDELDFVLGYANYIADKNESVSRSSIYRQVERFALQATALLHGKVLGGNGTNLLLRKAWFLEQGGFADLVQNKYYDISHFLVLSGKAERAALVVQKEAFVREMLPHVQRRKEILLEQAQNDGAAAMQISSVLYRKRSVVWTLLWAHVCLCLLCWGRVLRLLPLCLTTCEWENIAQYLGNIANFPMAYSSWEYAFDAGVLLLALALFFIPIYQQNRLHRVLGEATHSWYHHYYPLFRKS